MSTSLSATCGTIVLGLFLVLGASWWCESQKPTGWMGTDFCPMIKPLKTASGALVAWFAGLFFDQPKPPATSRTNDDAGRYCSTSVQQYHLGAASAMARAGPSYRCPKLAH